MAGFVLDEKMREQITTYAKRILSLEWEIKNIREDIKEIKSQAKQAGVPLKELNKAIKRLKEIDDEDIIETIEEILQSDPDIMKLIS